MISSKGKALMSSNESENLVYALRRIVHALDLHSRWLNKSFALTSPQLVSLYQIGRNEGLTTGELARRTSLSCATATGIVDRLEQRGLVKRERNGEDRRQVRLNLTEEGRLLSERRPPLLQEAFLEALDCLAAPERSQMLHSIQLLAEMMSVIVEKRIPTQFKEEGILEPGPLNPPLASKASPAGFLESCRMLMADGAASFQPEQQKTPELFVIFTREELNLHLSLDALVSFLHENLKPYEDAPPDIKAGIDYALSNEPTQGGFVLLAKDGEQLVGALIMLKTGMKGYVPPNLLLFVAVDSSRRGQGIGAALIRRAQGLSEGDIKLHCEYANPARRLYERLGFTSKYAEMRWMYEPGHHQP